MEPFLLNWKTKQAELTRKGQWTTTHGQPITKPRFVPTSMASSENRLNDIGDQPQRLGSAKGWYLPRDTTKGRSNDTFKSMSRSQSSYQDRRASGGILIIL